MKNNSGFTLLETILYLGLFAIVIGGGMIATYQIVTSTKASDNHVIMEEEANFLLRKINWALTGATSFTFVASPPSLTVTKNIGGSATTLFFASSGNNLTLKRGAGTAVVLNSSNISLSNLIFSATGSNGMTTAFTLTTVQDGKSVTENFSSTKYLRQ